VSNVDQLHFYIWLLLAAGLGATVGLEREYRGHEAGMRTTALVCSGAALFGLISRDLGDTRIAAAVVQGIGFLGAGVVFQRGHLVHGITTAATIWVMAAVGLLVASHLWLTAVLTTATVLVMLELAPVSDAVLRRGRSARAAEPRRAQPEEPPPA
jgi:putative Mg2+ transporter-C (MgtC) family protein